jgi:glucose-1-phosphate cytidylyltransferase
VKVVILAGGIGTRLSEETRLRPKPMVEIGGRPILWHLMKYFSAYGHDDFIVCCGYMGEFIKQYFVDYRFSAGDIEVNLKTGTVSALRPPAEEWRVSLVDTGETTMTGGRLKRVQHLLTPGEPFFMTYGDGLSDVNLDQLVAFHQEKGRLATVTSVVEPGRFGDLAIVDGIVEKFVEKPKVGRWINGGFFVLDPSTLDLVEGDATVWEREPLESLSKNRQLSAFEHRGFWQPMDTLRDRSLLESLYLEGNAPWTIWDQKNK